MRKAELAEGSGADHVAIVMTIKTKVHHRAGHDVSLEGGTNKLKAATEVTRNHHLEMRVPRSCPTSEVEEAGVAVRNRSDLTAVANRRDVVNEAAVALVNALVRMSWIVQIRAQLTFLKAKRTTRIHDQDDGGADDLKHPETVIANEVRGGDAPNVDAPNGASVMKNTMNSTRKYERPARKKKRTKKVHDHEHAVVGAGGVVEAEIVTRAEIEMLNRLASPITSMTLC